MKWEVDSIMICLCLKWVPACLDIFFQEWMNTNFNYEIACILLYRQHTNICRYYNKSCVQSCVQIFPHILLPIGQLKTDQFAYFMTWVKLWLISQNGQFHGFGGNIIYLCIESIEKDSKALGV